MADRRQDCLWVQTSATASLGKTTRALDLDWLCRQNRLYNPAMTSPEKTSDRGFFLFNAVVSTLATAFLAWLLLMHKGADGGLDLSFMPAVNAGLNSLAATFLVAGWIAIRRGHRSLHQRLMVAAFASSAVFLIGYVAYHYAHGDTRYPESAPYRTVYLGILATHVVLSITVVPLALSAFWFAAKKRFQTHRRVTRVLAPIWLYVSVTGVVIYFMLRNAAA